MGANENLLKSMQTIADNAVDNAPYDVTRKGRIIESDNGNNLYTVMIDGISYPRISAYGEASFNVGDVVRVLIPGSQPSQMFILVPNDGGSGDEFVPISRTINGKALSSDIILDGSDINYNEDTTINQAIEGKQDALVSGTNIRTINGKSILGGGNLDTFLSACSARGSNNVTLNQNAPKKLTLTFFVANTDSDAFEIYNGGIRCKKAGTVSVGGACYISQTKPGSIGAYIYLNSSELTSGLVYPGATTVSEAITVAPIVINVSEGDVFYLYGRQTASSGVAYTNNQATHLSIMYVDGCNATHVDGSSGSIDGDVSAISWGDIINKPSTFTPSPHTHIVDQITDVEGLTNMEIEDLLNGQA